MSDKPSKLKIADREFTSRLLVGTGKFASNELMRDALEARAPECPDAGPVAGDDRVPAFARVHAQRVTGERRRPDGRLRPRLVDPGHQPEALRAHLPNHPERDEHRDEHDGAARDLLGGSTVVLAVSARLAQRAPSTVRSRRVRWQRPSQPPRGCS